MNGHCNHLALKFSVCVKERQDRLPTMYWLPKLHKTPYKARFIANSSSCTTTELSKLLTSCLTAVKNHVIRYCEKVYERSGTNLFWSIKNSGEVLNKLKSRGFRATSLSTYDFYTLYTTLPHNLIKEKLINLIEWTFKREGSPYIACNERQAFFTSEDTKRYKLWSCQNVCEALIYLLDIIYIRFGTKLYRQIVGIPMDTNCAPLVADLFLFCYERDFMTSLSDVKQAEIIEAFKTTSRYLDDLLNIDNPYFEGMVNRIYPPELQLNKANMVWAGAFLSVAWPTGVQLLVFFCSSVPVVLFDTPGISRCRSQHISVESSSLLDPDIKLFILVGLGRSFFVCCLAHRGSTVGFLLLQFPVVLFDTPGISRCRSQHISVESSSLLHHSIYL